MYDFMCMGCGVETSADPTNYTIDQDCDVVLVQFQLRCPKCGREHKCSEIFNWDGVTKME